MSRRRRILAQGERDSACFLYSVVNSIYVHTGRKVTQSGWRKCLNSLPYNLDHYINGNGTYYLKNDATHFEKICRHFCEALDVRANVSSVFNIKSLKDLERIIDKDTIIVGLIWEGDHWLSVVDVDKEHVYVACSLAAHNDFGDYKESRSPRLKRYFNNRYTFSDIGWSDRYALLLKKK